MAAHDFEAKHNLTEHTQYDEVGASQAIIEAAVAASNEESKITWQELFSRYWPAVAYSGLLSLALIMEGMDFGLINNFFAQDAYLKTFGWPDANGKQGVPTSWQSVISNGNNVGSIVVL
jgi:MFS transporter, SP family, general alpha glucoside:H+ symporter